jgi:hypothetical protein
VKVELRVDEMPGAARRSRPAIVTKPTTVFIPSSQGQFAAARGFFGNLCKLTNWLITA